MLPGILSACRPPQTAGEFRLHHFRVSEAQCPPNIGKRRGRTNAASIYGSFWEVGRQGASTGRKTIFIVIFSIYTNGGTLGCYEKNSDSRGKSGLSPTPLKSVVTVCQPLKWNSSWNCLAGPRLGWCLGCKFKEGPIFRSCNCRVGQTFSNDTPTGTTLRVSDLPHPPSGPAIPISG